MKLGPWVGLIHTALPIYHLHPGGLEGSMEDGLGKNSELSEDIEVLC